MTLIMPEIDPTDNPDTPDDAVDEWDDMPEKEWVDEDEEVTPIEKGEELPDGFHEVDPDAVDESEEENK